MTPDEANAVLRTACECLRDRRPPPLAWVVQREGGRDVVAEAWGTAGVALLAMVDAYRALYKQGPELDPLDPPGAAVLYGSARYRVRWLYPTPTLAMVLTALERGRQEVAT